MTARDEARELFAAEALRTGALRARSPSAGCSARLRGGLAPDGADLGPAAGAGDVELPRAPESLRHDPVREIRPVVGRNGGEEDALLVRAEHDVPADPLAHRTDRAAPGGGGQISADCLLHPSTQHVYGSSMRESREPKTPRELGRIQLPLNPEEKDLLRRAAQHEGLPTTQYIRTNMLRLARELIGGGR